MAAVKLRTLGLTVQFNMPHVRKRRVPHYLLEQEFANALGPMIGMHNDIEEECLENAIGDHPCKRMQFLRAGMHDTEGQATVEHRPHIHQ